MEPDLHHLHHQQQSNPKQMNSGGGGGLTRYQSAPSSYFTSYLEKELCDELLNRPSSPETERFFARFLANTASSDGLQPDPVLAPVKQGSPPLQQGMDDYSSGSRSFYPPPPPPSSQSRPPLPSAPAMDYSRLPPTPPPPASKSGGGNNSSNLVRHSSSPAGLFSNINIEFENGYAVIRGMGDFVGNRESSGRMSPIAEIDTKDNIVEAINSSRAESSSDFGEAHHPGNYAGSTAGFPMGSWDDSGIMKGGLSEDDRTFSGLNDSQDVEGGGNRPPMLAHHLSLPKTAAEMSALEKLLHLQDSVPCKIRAKRGFATHPRSIAERVRRTRISERMRKLQDLVPNMDKQTNTADMLDLAVDYIKDLQTQVKVMADSRAKCTCTSTSMHQS
ncbi:unnamed protein product [Linum tenue]|uniref:BHLH domain-containing protein n=1 Tax=Linum tenue TaxID=586396 RepID=A0AAV0JSZ9_9ROSI|nr:unnamed protein product [Linum tenue]